MKRGLLLAFMILATPGTAAAQSWPDRPIKFITSQAAGNATDLITRIMADQLSPRLGQPIVVENRPGGGNVIGTTAAAHAAPDGYTFFLASAAVFVTDPYTFKSLPYDAMKDFVVVSKVAAVSFMLMAHPSVPAKTLPELIALVKAEPDKYSIVTDGQRRFSGMVVAWFNKLAGTRISQVPYTAMTQGVQDAVAGRVQLIILGVPNAIGLANGGKLTPLAITALKRQPGLDDIPTVAETFPGFDFTGWWVLAAPAGTPQPILERMNREVNAVLAQQDLQARLQKMRFYTDGGGTMQEAHDYVQQQYAAWGKLVKEIGIQPQ
jgi:tripartite-type tricarboxylate transporter receptor subunit TctC